jgi:hypothetical protein
MHPSELLAKKLCFSKQPTCHGSLLAEIGQKLDFRALFNEIYIKIEVFSILELNYTSVPIAQLVACLTFFIRFWPGLT